MTYIPHKKARRDLIMLAADYEAKRAAWRLGAAILLGAILVFILAALFGAFGHPFL